MMALLRRRYGASPAHLLAHVLLLPLAGWAILQVLSFRGARDVVVWFVAALILHDLVGLPAYTALDRLLQRLPRLRGVAVVNHVRVVAVSAGVSMVVFFPLILGRATGSLRYLSGVQPSGYLGRWLLLVACVAALSALVLAVRVLRADDLHDAAIPPADDDVAGR
jgi:hypothetical protein